MQSAQKSRKLTLDLNTSKFSICSHLNKLRKESVKISQENVSHSSVGEMLCFSMIKQGHFQQESHGKILDFS